MSAGGDGGDVVCAGAHGVWGFEGFVDGEVAPCAGEVVSFEDFCPFAPVLCVTGSAHVVAPPFDFGHKKTPIRISGPVGVLTQRNLTIFSPAFVKSSILAQQVPFNTLKIRRPVRYRLNKINHPRKPALLSF